MCNYCMCEGFHIQVSSFQRDCLISGGEVLLMLIQKLFWNMSKWYCVSFDNFLCGGSV